MKDLGKQEKDLLRRIEQARLEYDEGARAAACGDVATDLASVRARIATLEGELADIRAAIQSAEHLADERASVAAREQRIELLKSIEQTIGTRCELAPKLVSQIAAVGETYRAFVRLGEVARVNALKADASNHLFQSIDVALGVRDGIDQALAGLFYAAGFKKVMEQPGALWVTVAEGRKSFVDTTLQRSSRATTVVQNQIDQEISNAETHLPSRRAS